MKIDYVFPWVDPSDPLWQDDYKNTFGDINFDPARFRELGLMKYVLRSIEQNMPWINNVYILMARESQVPVWLNTDKVKVIFHDQFIPKEFLPIFNSAAIEQFLAFLPGVEEYFIYGNDDFYINSPTEPTDFFSVDGIPKITFEDRNKITTYFMNTCKNCFDLIKEDFENQYLPEYFIKPFHAPTPMLMSTVKKVWELHSDEMKKRINIKRNVFTDLNQYLYTDYQIISGNYKRVAANGKYIQLDKDIDEIISAFRSPVKLLCVNDVEKSKIENFPRVRGLFFEKWPSKSKYER